MKRIHFFKSKNATKKNFQKLKNEKEKRKKKEKRNEKKIKKSKKKLKSKNVKNCHKINLFSPKIWFLKKEKISAKKILFVAQY